jgi:hypothetical protein
MLGGVPGKAEVLGNAFVGPTDCPKYGGSYCIYPWFSWDGGALNFGVTYPNTVDRLGQETSSGRTRRVRRTACSRGRPTATRSSGN